MNFAFGFFKSESIIGDLHYFVMNYLETIIHNQVLMTFLIASMWIIPGFVFTRMVNHKFKRRELERQAKKVSKLYPS